MSFDTIWGNIEFPSQEEEPSKNTESAPVKSESEESEAEGAEDQENSDDAEKDEKPKETEDATDVEDSKIEYSDDQLDAAFDILDSQGILDLDDDEEVDASPEGIAAAVASTIRKRVAKELETAPDSVKRLFTHLQNGGSEEDFEFVSSAEDWSEMNEDDEDNQKLAYTQLLINQGMTVEEAEEEVEEAVSSGKLEKKSALAFKALIKLEEEEKLKKVEDSKLADKKAREKADKDIEDLKAKINAIDDIAGFKMTEDRTKAFEDYLFKIDKKTGKTQLQLNMADEDRKLKIAFLDFIEFNKGDISKEVETELTKTRKRKLTRHKNKTAANSNSSKTVTPETKNTGKIVFPSIFSPNK